MSRVYAVVRPALLKAASTTPQSQLEMLDKLKEMGEPLYVSTGSLQQALSGLTRQGLLVRSGEGRNRNPYRYALPEVGQG